jgi:hypothetical protein
MNTLTLDPSIAEEEGLVLEAVDVTGTNAVTARRVNPGTPVHALTGVLAARMQLPDAPWAMRSDRTGAFLDEDRSIGDQYEETGPRVVLSPKSHLGSGR